MMVRWVLLSGLRARGSVLGSPLVGTLIPSNEMADLRVLEWNAEELEIPLEYCPPLVL